MQLALRDRFKAFSIHLGISILIFAAALWLIAMVWYPQPYFEIAGGWQGVRIMILVDIVLGPMLTFMIFDRSKGWPKLRFDLWCIAIAQALALLWGFWAVDQQRPLASVYWEGKFHLLTAGDYGEQSVGPEALDRFEGRQPLLLSTQEPADQEQVAGVLAYQMVSGLMPWQLDFLHAPLSSHWPEVRAKAKSPEAHLQRFPDASAELERIVARAGMPADSLVFFPVTARYGSAMLVFDQSGKVVGALPGESYDDGWIRLPGI